MKRSRFSEEQIIAILREQEAGAKTVEVCRKHGISDATFGRALFDTGLHPDCQHDPAGRLAHGSPGCSASVFGPVGFRRHGCQLNVSIFRQIGHADTNG